MRKLIGGSALGLRHRRSGFTGEPERQSGRGESRDNQPANRLDDVYTLAHNGTYGSLQEAERTIVGVLSRYERYATTAARVLGLLAG